jgi:hypothetical protein
MNERQPESTPPESASAGGSRRRVFRAGCEVAGPDGATIHLILRGRLHLERLHPDVTGAVVLLECGPGDLIGMPTALNEGRWALRAVEETETELLDGPGCGGATGGDA